ncbi:MAG: hypothetical protein J6I64_09545, partial [Lachnospiraceae bacterium]|nr:hypothetical protein [Lachnospiraceae bacterium]
MDKYEYTIKSDKIKKLVERKDYETAVKIADTIDWERVRNIKMLSTVSLAYEKMSRFEEAKDLLLMAYECAPVGRRFLYKLTELAVKQGEFDEAEQYLKEFAATSPQDPSRLLLRYEISKAKGEPTERQITILEAYQKREFEERWSYELANLYYRVGKNEECVKLCDEIVLWFGVGTYVDKAMELKQRIAPLTPDQIEKRENKEKYLRRLEEVQREFEDKYRVVEAPGKEAIEQAALTSQELAAAVENVMADETAEAVTEVETVMGDEVLDRMLYADESESVDVSEMEQGDMEEETSEPQRDLTEAAEGVSVPFEEMREAQAELEVQRLQEEMEASLAREIEAAALTAALNEAMLRETAATMESMEAVENDHSQEHERTKVAVVHVSMHEKTKEFVREAKVIKVVLEEAGDRAVTVEEVEARLQEDSAAEVVEEVLPVEESAQEPAAEVVEEEPPVEESAQEPIAEPALEESPVEEKVSAPTVHDHYILVACAQEDEGVKECVAYIRRMRELLGYPVTQIAKIRGAKLAMKNMAQTLHKLQGRDLVVVGISELPDDLLVETVELMARDMIESFIALIGSEAEIAGLQSRLAFFAGCRVLPCGVETWMPQVTAEPEEAQEEPEKIMAEEPADSAEETAAESEVEDEQSMLARLVEE